MDKHIKKEIMLIVTLLAVGVVALIILRLCGGGQKAVVTYGGEEYGVYDLNKDQRIEIVTELGTNVFEIKGGSINMISADCPDKICVNMLPISEKLPGVIVCLPHQLVIEIRD